MTEVSILPANASDFEKALEVAVARLALIKIPISTLWDARLCPLDVLPFLAWALSVDQWREEWTEETKRRVVETSLEIHEKKGTRSALDLVLKNFDLSVKVTEWFEQSPPGRRGTYKLNVYSETQPITDAFAADVLEAVDNVKRHSMHLESFSLNLKSRVAVAVGCVMVMGEKLKVFPRQLERISLPVSVNVGVGLALLERVKIMPRVPDEL